MKVLGPYISLQNYEKKTNYLDSKDAPAKVRAFIRDVTRIMRDKNREEYDGSSVKNAILHMPYDKRDITEIQRTGIKVEITATRADNNLPFQVKADSLPLLQEWAFQLKANMILGYSSRMEVTRHPPFVQRRHYGYPVFIKNG